MDAELFVYLEEALLINGMKCLYMERAFPRWLGNQLLEARGCPGLALQLPPCARSVVGNWKPFRNLLCAQSAARICATRTVYPQ